MLLFVSACIKIFNVIEQLFWKTFRHVPLLGQAYGVHKGDFALGRYEELKAMIKGAVSEYNVLLAQTKARGLGGKYDNVAKQYGVGGKQPQGGDSSATGSKKGGGVLGSLKQSAQAMATHQDGPRSSAGMGLNVILCFWLFS